MRCFVFASYADADISSSITLANHFYNIDQAGIDDFHDHHWITMTLLDPQSRVGFFIMHDAFHLLLLYVLQLSCE